MSTMLLEELAAAGGSNAGGGGASFIGTFNQGASGYYCEALTVDGSGNLYLLMRQPSTVVKYNKSGVLQWQRQLPADKNMYAIAVTASGNVYVGGDGGQVCTLNDVGAFQPAATVSYAGSYPVNIRGMAVDASGNVYVCGTFLGEYGAVVKLSSSLEFIWGRYQYGGTPVGISVSNTANGFVWVVHGNAALVTKLDAGTGAPFASLTNYTATTGTGICNDASGNAYVCGSLYEGMYLFKLNDSNTAALWGQKLTDFTNYLTAQAVSCDTSGNVYVVGRGPANGGHSVISAKYNSLGILQWQRKLYTGAGGAGYGASAVFDGFLYSGGYFNAAAGNGALFAKLPDNGTKTGGYAVGGNTATYAAGGVVEQSTTPSVARSTQYANGLSFNAAFYFVTVTAVSLTSYVTSV